MFELEERKSKRSAELFQKIAGCSNFFPQTLPHTRLNLNVLFLFFSQSNLCDLNESQPFILNIIDQVSPIFFKVLSGIVIICFSPFLFPFISNFTPIYNYIPIDFLQICWDYLVYNIDFGATFLNCLKPWD